MSKNSKNVDFHRFTGDNSPQLYGETRYDEVC